MNKPIEQSYWQCSRCGKNHALKETAEKCCEARTCDICGKPLQWAVNICQECIEKGRFDKAEKVDLKDWDGPVFTEAVDNYDGMGYFEDVGEFVEFCKESYSDAEIEDLPAYVWACETVKHKLCIDNALESMLDEAHEDAYEQLNDVKQLEDYVAQWNAKQTVESWYPDYKKVVLLPEQAEVKSGGTFDE
jgi:hypothetical protein